MKSNILIFIAFLLIFSVHAVAQTKLPPSQSRPVYNQLPSVDNSPVFVRPKGTPKGAQPFNLKAMVRDKKKNFSTEKIPLTIYDSRISRLSSEDVIKRREEAKKEQGAKAEQSFQKAQPAINMYKERQKQFVQPVPVFNVLP